MVEICKRVNWKAWLSYLIWMSIIAMFYSDLDMENKWKTIWTTQLEAIESNARYTARAMVKWIWECIKKEYQNKPFTSIKDMEEKISLCGADHRSGWPTWDFFVFDRVSRTMVFDWSSDCMKGWEWRDFDFSKEYNYLQEKKEVWECWMHTDQNLCVTAIKDLYQIWNTDELSNIYWKFDDDYEWLESYVIPSLSEWFNWRLWAWWVFSINNAQLQIVVWTQQDEVMNFYKKSIELFVDIEKQNIFSNYFKTVMIVIFYLLLTLALNWLKKCEK